MDQYPDENEEFELQYQDELELLEDMPHEYDACDDGPSTSRQAAATLDRQQQQIQGAGAIKDVSRFSNSTLSSPQLSQITFEQVKMNQAEEQL